MEDSNLLQQKLRTVKSQLPYLPRALRLIWQSAPGLALGWVAILIIQGLLPAVSITLTRLLINQLVLVLQHIPYPDAVPWHLLSPAILLSGGIAAVVLVGQLLQSLGTWFHTAQAEQVGMHVSMLIQEKASQSDYSLFESSEKNDKLYRARVEATYRPTAVLDSLGMLAQGLVTLVSMLALLLPYGFFPVLILFISSLPVLWVLVDNRRKQFAWQKRIASQERRTWYYDWLLTSTEGAAELRLFGTRSIFLTAYQQIRSQIKKERLSLEQHQLLGQFIAYLIGLLAAGVCVAFMFWRMLQGAVVLGDLVLFYQVISQSQSVVRNQLHNAGQLYGSLLFLSHLFEFLDMENTVQDLEQPQQIIIRPEGVTLALENLSFAYPDSATQVLSGFNLTLPAGQICAIVGDNGAGKSTLLKLICRLYDPQSGRITWNGTDLRDLSLKELRGQITMLFQEPMHYQASAVQNIRYGSIGNSETKPEDIIRASESAGSHSFLNKLPDGYQTQLGKWFEHGTELSVGQWQRVALARAFFRQSPLMVLDEPTSAMDAWSEIDWLSRLRSLRVGKTTLIITHRLTTAMQADIIYVMADGQVLESGSHSELVAQNGRYAQAWFAQVREKPFMKMDAIG